MIPEVVPGQDSH